MTHFTWCSKEFKDKNFHEILTPPLKGKHLDANLIRISMHSINLPLSILALSEVLVFHICTQSFPRWAQGRMNICPIFMEGQCASAIRQTFSSFPPPFHQPLYAMWSHNDVPQDGGGAVTCRTSHAIQTPVKGMFPVDGRHCLIMINRPGAEPGATKMKE